MSGIARFLIIAVIGVGLGAGLAFLMKGKAVDAPVVEQSAMSTPAATGTDVVPGAPAMPAADGSTPAVAGSDVGGAFTLTDMNGNTVTEKSWPGKLKLVFFGFTNCPDICPAAMDKVTTALNSIGTTDKIQPLFITVDPARDTGDALKTYLGNYHSSFVGLTGTEEQLKAAQDGYKVYAAKQAPADAEHAEHYNVDHSGYIYLIDENEKLLEIFGTSDTAETIAEKIKTHLTDAGQPAPELAPVAADTPATDTPATDTPAATDSTDSSAPASDTPAVTDDVPAAPETTDAPAADAPASTEEPAADAPATDAPAADDTTTTP